MEKIIFHVTGMSCGHCEKAVENALEDVGVTAKASAKNSTVAVEFDPNKITQEAIKAEIREAGYNV